eukprot:scaffold118417_cov67-Phaeocystis_antarctica.AAC.1
MPPSPPSPPSPPAGATPTPASLSATAAAPSALSPSSRLAAASEKRPVGAWVHTTPVGHVTLIHAHCGAGSNRSQRRALRARVAPALNVWTRAPGNSRSGLLQPFRGELTPRGGKPKPKGFPGQPLRCPVQAHQHLRNARAA